MRGKKSSTSPFSIELFEGVGQWSVFLGACVLLFSLSLGLEYRSYLAFNKPNLAKEAQEIYAKVIAQYQKSKEGKPPYWVLKLKSQSGAIFYTTSKEDLKDISNRYVRLWGVGGGRGFECGFYDYLQSCFFNAYRISLLHERDYRDYFREWIEAQHTHETIASLYKTLFIADFLPKVWRDISNKLGVAHLIAISGFHLGVLSLVLGGVLGFVYGRLHHRFSYRNKIYDIGGLVLIGMLIYLVVLDFTPSFLRAFVMAAFGLYVLYSGVRLLSFGLLFAVVCVCVALFPRLLFSVGFVLSVCGVFFIYLFVRYFWTNQNLDHKRLESERLNGRTLAKWTLTKWILNSRALEGFSTRTLEAQTRHLETMGVLDSKNSESRGIVEAGCAIDFHNTKSRDMLGLNNSESSKKSFMLSGVKSSLDSEKSSIFAYVAYVLRKFCLLPLFFNSVIFLNMLPIVHWYFPYFTPLSLVSIPLTLCFVVFFPLAMTLHAIGLGFVFDGFFAWCEGLEIESIEFYTPWWGLGIFLALCVGAMRYKSAYMLLNLASFGFFLFLCGRYFGVV